MVITQSMVEAYAKRFNIDLEDGSQKPGIEGTLAGWANGQGELDAELVNGNLVMLPVAEAYYAAKGVEVPDSVKVPLTPIDEGVTNVMAEAAPEAAPEAEVMGEEKLPEAEVASE